MRIEADELPRAVVDDDFVHDHPIGRRLVFDHHAKFEVRAQAMVRRDRVERVGEVGPLIDAVGNRKRLGLRRDVEKILDFLNAERRSERHEPHDVDLRGEPGQHLERHDGSLAVRDERDRSAPVPRKCALEPAFDLLADVVVEKVGGRVGDEGF